MQISAASIENIMVIPKKKIKNRAAIWSTNPNTGCISKGDCLVLLKRHVHSHIYYSTIHINQKLENNVNE